MVESQNYGTGTYLKKKGRKERILKECRYIPIRARRRAREEKKIDMLVTQEQ